MILAILQARTSSSRLPGKVLKKIMGKPMLQLQTERVLRCQNFDKLIIATSVSDSDDSIAKLCSEIGLECFRGSLNDVLDRFYQAALKYAAEHVVRLTGDCPLADPILIDQLIDFHIRTGADYSSNSLDSTLPDGLDAEIFKFSVLKTAWSEATLPSEREHVTPFIYKHPNRFNIRSWKYPENLSHHRWTVDEPEDFEFVSRVFQELLPNNAQFGMHDVLNLIHKKPDLAQINANIPRNEGYTKSLLNDQFSNKNTL